MAFEVRRRGERARARRKPGREFTNPDRRRVIAAAEPYLTTVVKRMLQNKKGRLRHRDDLWKPLQNPLWPSRGCKSAGRRWSNPPVSTITNMSGFSRLDRHSFARARDSPGILKQLHTLQCHTNDVISTASSAWRPRSWRPAADTGRSRWQPAVPTGPCHPSLPCSGPLHCVRPPEHVPPAQADYRWQA